MVSNGLSKQDVIDRATTLDFPSSVVEFYQGYLGQPYGGFPEPLRTHIIRNRPRIDGRPGATMAPYDFDAARKKLQDKYGRSAITSLGAPFAINVCKVLIYPFQNRRIVLRDVPQGV